jgi:cysteinyl-tRNA synthetase
MNLYNSLTRQIDDFVPINQKISIYSCGPTVYNNLHIGNLAAFIYADLLRRVLSATFPEHDVTHVMNITDVDDKTIRDSKLALPDTDPMSALIEFTRKYEKVFQGDTAKVGNGNQAITFIRATDSIVEMHSMISSLIESGFAYTSDDGIYFSIEAYKKAGKKYGQLVNLDNSTSSMSRIDNDEYDKDTLSDFALWKLAKPGEPSWAYTVDGKDYSGRPGWHIECSAMSHKLLGVQFDIHIGGIDLLFPHHENEIAQSTANTTSDTMAKFFVHSNHIMIDGKKMSKSLNNFYTLRDIEEKGYSPMAFRLMVLQAHYQNSANFSWDNLTAATNRLNNWRAFAALRWQVTNTKDAEETDDTQSTNNQHFETFTEVFTQKLTNNLDTPGALAAIDELISSTNTESTLSTDANNITKAIEQIRASLGIDLLASTPDTSDAQKDMITARQKAREDKNWPESDRLRGELKAQGITLKDEKTHQIWSYL